jgi:NADH:ubiquinone oxidoreductase subunit C
MNADAIADRLGAPHKPERRTDGDWLLVPDLDVRAMVGLMAENESRFVTMTVIPEGDRFRFVYHWDVEGGLLNVTTHVDGAVATSIADILPAADWVERETRDYYALEFAGRSETPALMLQENDEPGLFTRTAAMGRDADPADTGWSDTASPRTEEDR